MFRILAGRGLLSAALGLLLMASWTVAPVSADSTEFTDIAHDAYRYPGPVPQGDPKPPNPILSNETADIIRVSFATTSGARPGHERAYTVSLTVTGKPDRSVEYLAGAQFGENCVLFHPLRPGQTGDAKALCRRGQEPGRYSVVGSIAATETFTRGSTVSATYSFKQSALPDSLRHTPELGPLYAYTCAGPEPPATGTACGNDIVDFARDAGGKFRI